MRRNPASALHMAGAVHAGFLKRGLQPVSAPPDSAVANVRFDRSRRRRPLELLAPDMRYGMVLLGRPYRPRPRLRSIAQLNNPAHITMADFDGDGVKDFFVGDLGEFLPADHSRGAVVWLRGGRSREVRAAGSHRLAARRRRGAG